MITMVINSSFNASKQLLHKLPHLDDLFESEAFNTLPISILIFCFDTANSILDNMKEKPMHDCEQDLAYDKISDL